jgi:tetratricopeptide (TPR) repeat protein
MAISDIVPSVGSGDDNKPEGKDNKHIFSKLLLDLMKFLCAGFILLLVLITSAQCQQTAKDWIQKGDDYSEDRVYDLANKCYGKALMLDPNNNDVWTAKCYVLYSQGKYDEAIKAIDEALRLDPNDTDARYVKAHALAAQKKYDLAIKIYDEVFLQDPTYTPVLQDKSQALMEQGKYDEAIEVIDEAIAIIGDKGIGYGGDGAWKTKGDILTKQGKYDEAIDAYDEALLISEWSAPWYSKGNALKALGRTSEADAAFAKAKELDAAAK